MKKILLLIAAVLMTALAALADVEINDTNFPDPNFRAYLLSEYPSGTITTAELNARTRLDLMNKNISNMRGVQYFTELTYLSCYGNDITTIDVSQNTKLTYLNLGDNQLSSIWLNNNKQIEELYLQNNQLKTLVASLIPNMHTLWLDNNPLLYWVVCYGDNLQNLRVTNCPLTHIECYSNPNLSSVSGLAECTGLKYLDCMDCAFTDLSFTNSMDDLQVLLCSNNKLTRFDLHYKNNLEHLWLDGNQQLTFVEIYGSHMLTDFKISGCRALTTLYCFANSKLSEITGLADCVNLEKIVCGTDALIHLDGLTGMANLEYVSCMNNKLTSLDFTGCNSLNYVDCSWNMIDSDGMQTLVNSLPQRDASHPGELYALCRVDSVYELNEMTDAQAITAYNKRWNVLAWLESGDEPIVSLDKVLAPDGSIHFTTGGDYPWILAAADGPANVFAMSGNAGIPNSSSTLTATVDVGPGGASLTFMLKARGEGAETVNDVCRFADNGRQIFAYGSRLGDTWRYCNTTLTPGTHTLTWTYTKNGSINPEGDFFAIANVVLEFASAPGDVNGDNDVNISDVIMLINLISQGSPSLADYPAADYDGDGQINITDVTKIINFLLQ